MSRAGEVRGGREGRWVKSQCILGQKNKREGGKREEFKGTKKSHNGKEGKIADLQN